MADDEERAAKAARAKALLKKRQQKKAAGAAVAAGPSSPVTSPPPSRSFTPAPAELASPPPPPPPTSAAEQPVQEKHDLADVFDVSNDGPNTSVDWLSGLTRAPTPPPVARVQRHSPPVASPVASPPISALTSPPPSSALPSGKEVELQQRVAELEKVVADLRHFEARTQELQSRVRDEEGVREELERRLQELQHRITDVEGEKSALSVDVARLKPLEAEIQQLGDELQEWKSAAEVSDARIKQLDDQLVTLQDEKQALSDDAARFKARNEELEAELQPNRGRIQELETYVEQLHAENETLQQNQQQTISLLVSEKAHLASEVERLVGFEDEAQHTAAALEAQQKTVEQLEEQLHRLQTDAHETANRIQQSEAREKELADKTRDQEREITLANASIQESKKEAEKQQRKLHELREQIQNDDRLDRAEASLKNTQNRADELEFQLSKLKQVHSSVKSERDEFDGQLASLRTSEQEWKTKHSSLYEEHNLLRGRFDSATQERDALAVEKATLQSQAGNAQQTLSQLNDKLKQVASELVAGSRQLQATQTELKAATRRAEEAETMQKDLQSEGTTLMRSLDEMRTKTVELTGARVELVEKLSGLEHSLKNRDAAIASLEGDIDEARHGKEQAEERLQNILAQHKKDSMLAQSSAGELQKAYTDLREELDLATDSMRSLEAERASHRQELSRRLDEIEHVTMASNAQQDELSMLRQEIAQREHAREEERGFLDGAQNEIEALRAELASRDDEIERLLSSKADESGQSLDDELLSSMRQQHDLELSAAQSRIRSLENAVFEAEGKAHSLKKQVGTLEEELVQARSIRSNSPLPRPVSRAASSRSHGPSSLSRSVLDQNLSLETRHKRKVSLSMLKARIDSEVAAAAAAHGQMSHPSSRALSPVLSADGMSRPATPPVHVHHRRPQFLDESHVFWCHSCHGDLVIL